MKLFYQSWYVFYALILKISIFLQDILVERLNSGFLLNRSAWIKQLQEINADPAEVETSFSRGEDDPLFASTLGSTSRHLQAISSEADYLASYSELLALGFPEPLCKRGLEHTRGMGVEAAVEWMVAHLEDDVVVTAPVNDVESPRDKAVSSPISLASSEHTAVASPTGQRLLLCIHQLRSGIKGDPSVTRLSRQVITIFLSRRLPNELCWLIFSYTMSAEEIKRILLHTTHNSSFSMRNSGVDTADMLRQAGYLLSEQHAAILAAKIATPELAL